MTDDKLVARVLREVADACSGLAMTRRLKQRAAELDQDAPPSVLDTKEVMPTDSPTELSGATPPAQPQAEAGAGDLKEAMAKLSVVANSEAYTLSSAPAKTLLSHIAAQDARIAELVKDLDHASKYAQQWVTMERRAQSKYDELRKWVDQQALPRLATLHSTFAGKWFTDRYGDAELIQRVIDACPKPDAKEPT